MRGDLIALDLETTGLDIQRDSIIEIGAVRLRDGVIIGEYSTLIDPGFVIPVETTHITNIYPEDLRGAPTLKEALPHIATFIGSAPVIAHSATFDIGFMRRFGLLQQNPTLDTLEIASVLLPRVPRYGLGALTQLFDIQLENAHRALDDARATALLYWHLWQKAQTIPAALLREICQAAQPFNWDALPFFEAVLAEKPAAEAAPPPTFAVFQSSAEPLVPIQPNAPLQALDSTITQAILDEGGALAEHIGSYEHRPQQIEMAQAVAAALSEGRHLLVEAGTGTGKSLAYLVPALQWAARNQTRVVISTNTIPLQEQLVQKDLPLVQAALGLDVKVSIMKGRDNYLCPRRLAAVRRRRPTNIDEMKTLAKLLIWLQDSQAGDRSEINLRFGENFAWNRMSARDEGCALHRCNSVMAGACPFFKARRRAENAHVVIVNHALLIADAMSDNRVLPEYRYLIIDEAHTLEDAITNGLSVRLDMVAILRRVTDLGGLNGGILGDFLRNARASVPEKTLLKLESFIETIGDVAKSMQAQVRGFFGKAHDFVRDANQNDTPTLRLEPKLRATSAFAALQAAWTALDEYFAALTDALEQLSSALNKLEKFSITDFDDHLNSIASAAHYLQEVRAILNSFALQPDPNTIYWVNPGDSPDTLVIHAAPLHVGPMMEQYIWQNKEAVILTSATLQTNTQFDYIRERLYAEDAAVLALDSPFDYKSSTLIFIPQDIPEPNRPGYQKAVERGIIELAAALQGRVMVLFTSYTQLRETAPNIAPRLALGGITVYDQITGGNRENLLDSFKSTDRAVLLGTRSFWEGVDIPGSDLSALVIVRLPFGVPTEPVIAARSETYENAFKQFAIPDAILRFRQGFGRLIRTRTDRGIVAIFDSRIINKSYGTSFLEALPDCTLRYGSLAELAPAVQQWLDHPLPSHR